MGKRAVSFISKDIKIDEPKWDIFFHFINGIFPAIGRQNPWVRLSLWLCIFNVSFSSSSSGNLRSGYNIRLFRMFPFSFSFCVWSRWWWLFKTNQLFARKRSIYICDYCRFMWFSIKALIWYACVIWSNAMCICVSVLSTHFRLAFELIHVKCIFHSSIQNTAYYVFTSSILVLYIVYVL